MEKIRFKDLSIPLKVVIIFGWIALGLWFTFFFAGLIAGILGY